MRAAQTKWTNFTPLLCEEKKSCHVERCSALPRSCFDQLWAKTDFNFWLTLFSDGAVISQGSGLIHPHFPPPIKGLTQVDFYPNGTHFQSISHHSSVSEGAGSYGVAQESLHIYFTFHHANVHGAYCTLASHPGTTNMDVIKEFCHISRHQNQQPKLFTK